MIHLIFCLRHAAQALTLRDMPGSLESAALLAVGVVVLNCLVGTGRCCGCGLISSNDGRAFLGDEAWMEWCEDWCEWCDCAGELALTRPPNPGKECGEGRPASCQLRFDMINCTETSPLVSEAKPLQARTQYGWKTILRLAHRSF